MRTAVIISTYNNPQPLRMTLLGFLAQDHTEFEILIADDGSDHRTATVLGDQMFAPLNIRHVWHEDRGFRLSAIRNRAIVSTAADYFIFCDGDCIPRRDFVGRHVGLARINHFIAGTRVNVPAKVHQQFNDEDILSGRVFDSDFLARADTSLRRHRRRLACDRRWEPLWNLLTYRYCVFSGSNSSAWRDDLVRVNGFDESFPGYGSEDRDIGIRMRNSGVRSRYLKYSLVQLHLDHPQAYVRPDVAAANRKIFRTRMRDRTTRVDVGLDDVLKRP